MPRTPFAIMLAMTTFLALPATSVWAQDSASDATTPIDQKVGNDMPPTDNTLSNDEVRQLKQENTVDKVQGPSASVTTGDATPSVSGTTPSYKMKSGSAANSEGGDVTGQ